MKKLYFGGPILTMDREHPTAEAVLTEKGKILAVGSLADLRCPEAEICDLRGSTLMPGFVDGHSHMINMGVSLTQRCSLEGCRSFAEMLDRIRAFRGERNLVCGEPISARGYDLALLQENAHPTAALLDQLGVDNPICCIHQSGHMKVYNSAAMQKAGVSAATYVCPAGGFAGKDENGELSGYFEENAAGACNVAFESATPEKDMEEAVLAAQEYYIRQGFTTVQEGSGNGIQKIGCLDRLAKGNKLKVDIVAYMSATQKGQQDLAPLREEYGKSYKNHLKLGGVKFFLDGSPQAKTAWMQKPYEGETDYRGYPTLTAEQVEQRLQLALELGLQPMAHCNGDAASEQYVSAWEKVTEGGKLGKNLRPVMIHAQTVTYDQLDRMAKAGMMASFFVGHCFFWGDTHLQNMGSRGLRISPTKTALQKGVPFSFHQDSPVTPPDMLHSIWCAVNRITRSGVCIGKENRLGVYDALIAATRGGAYGYFEEDTKGVLKPGAVADFVILDKNPTAVDPMEIKEITVLATIKEDTVLYRRDKLCN